MFQSIFMSIFSGAHEQYFVQLLSWIPLMYIRCVFVQYAAVCHYCQFVCVSGAPVRLRSGHSVYMCMSWNKTAIITTCTVQQ
jgi:hypothetical protein